MPFRSRRCIHFSLPPHVAPTSGRAVYLTDRDGYRWLSSFDVNADAQSVASRRRGDRAGAGVVNEGGSFVGRALVTHGRLTKIRDKGQICLR